MPSAFRDPKTLSDWIQLDYFRRPRGLRRWRYWLGWGMLLAAAAGVAVVLLLPRGRAALQAGPVSSAHSFFNNDCGRCHREAFETAKRLWPVDAAAVRAVPNGACVACHDGPKHNTHELAEQSCAGCHREHRGRPALARVTDDHCTACHADLPANSDRHGATPFENVSRFPDRHPEFKLWRGEAPQDPGRLHFNHAVHLMLEGAITQGGEKSKLDCSDCHRADDAGRYMKPINYEEHCARCHPLSVRVPGPFGDDKLEAAAAEFAKTPALHKEPKIVRADLRERLIRFVQDNAVVATDPPLGRGIPRPRRLEGVTEQQWSVVKRELSEAEKLRFSNALLGHNEALLFDRPAGCDYCHVRREGKRGVSPRGQDDLPLYAPTSLPKRWLVHSRFGHDSHRMLKCTACHAQAPESTLTSDVLMPRIEVCANCHTTKVGVRNDCVECHGYHHRENGYEASKGLSIDQALGK